MKYLEETCGIPTLELMENAGKGIYLELKKRFNLKNKNIVILCGNGNNGGDGFVAARHLKNEAKVSVIFLGERIKLTDEAKINYFKVLSNIKNDINLIYKANILIDAMIGTGIKGEIEEPYSAAIDKFNFAKCFKVAIDIPTGLDPDTGQVLDKMCKVDLILTIHDMKPGLEKYKDKVIVVDIGIKKDDKSNNIWFR